MLNGLGCQHLTHIGLAGRVAYHAGAAAYQCDRLVACHLESLHQAQCHEVTNVQAVRSGVKTDIESCLTVVDKLLQLLFIGHLGDEPSSFQFFKTSHYYFLRISNVFSIYLYIIPENAISNDIRCEYHFYHDLSMYAVSQKSSADRPHILPYKPR